MLCMFWHLQGDLSWDVRGFTAPALDKDSVEDSTVESDGRDKIFPLCLVVSKHCMFLNAFQDPCTTL